MNKWHWLAYTDWTFLESLCRVVDGVTASALLHGRVSDASSHRVAHMSLFTMSLEQTEDLKAFERRLTEVIGYLRPSAVRWRFILVLISVCTATGAWQWLSDEHTKQVSFTQSLWNHPFFAVSCLLFILLFLLGIHKRVIAPSIISARCRAVLADYNMSCDDNGRLILKPRPTVNWTKLDTAHCGVFRYH